MHCSVEPVHRVKGLLDRVQVPLTPPWHSPRPQHIVEVWRIPEYQALNTWAAVQHMNWLLYFEIILLQIQVQGGSLQTKGQAITQGRFLSNHMYTRAFIYGAFRPVKLYKDLTLTPYCYQVVVLHFIWLSNRTQGLNFSWNILIWVLRSWQSTKSALTSFSVFILTYHWGAEELIGFGF